MKTDPDGRYDAAIKDVEGVRDDCNVVPRISRHHRLHLLLTSLAVATALFCALHTASSHLHANALNQEASAALARHNLVPQPPQQQQQQSKHHPRQETDEQKALAKLTQRVLAREAYGFGVRIGCYLQMAGMVISTACGDVRRVILLVAASLLGMALSYTVLMRDRGLAVSEAWCVLQPMLALAFLGTGGLYLRHRNLVNTLAMLVAEYWVMAMGFQFFQGKGYYQSTKLPALVEPVFRLDNQFAWFFVRTEISRGWFRYVGILGVAVLFAAVVWSTRAALLMAVPTITERRATARRQAAAATTTTTAGGGSGGHGGAATSTTNSSAQRQQAKRASDEGLHLLQIALPESWLLLFQSAGLALMVVAMVMAIVGTEMTIAYNTLLPQTKIATLTQTAPLVVGVLVLARSLHTLFLRVERWWRERRSQYQSIDTELGEHPGAGARS
ncbi:hypothetical protein Micbo1qcDRAFT_174481 [Microdochium bolleyi]|uniref:Uncharacterized protein n=1 Tax=Microdochium bolleyi TaxID=196109 RepID=A0A136J8H0_9PEZI|nr:hypothetical protein Micbo1qcDRAFT_174481 [Microdochium bolleyi]